MDYKHLRYVRTYIVIQKIAFVFFCRENKNMQTNLITKDLHKRPSFIKFDFFTLFDEVEYYF